MIDFACPHCEKMLRVSDQELGKAGKCRYCGGTFMVVLVEPPDATPAEDAEAYQYDIALESSPETQARVQLEVQSRAPLGNILDTHYLYEEVIAYFNGLRAEDPLALPLTAQACMQHIALAPEIKEAFAARGLSLPTHAGYETLAGIREKQRRFKDVVEMCMDAKAEGWAGDWDQRIARCRKTTVMKKHRE